MPTTLTLKNIPDAQYAQQVTASDRLARIRKLRDATEAGDVHAKEDRSDEA